jgi:cytochrome P450
MFHFLYTARDPDTGDFALTTENLIADSNLLTVAGTGTTSVTVTAFSLLLVTPECAELVEEIGTNFQGAEDIGSGSDLMVK